MTIHLPEELDNFIRVQVQSGRFRSEDEAISEAVRLLRQREGVELLPETAAPVPAWKRVLEIMQDVPEEVFDQVPADSSAQLDHYLYGSPKRPTS